MGSNELYQYSIVSALMDGVASQGPSISEILARGNHGLGTFRHLVGELIVLDGQAYQMKSDGSVTAIEASVAGTVSPFAMITKFEPTTTINAVLAGKDDLFNLLTMLLPQAHNHYMAMRISGTFKAVTVRTVGGQRVPHEGLAEVGEHQTSHTFTESMRGTIIGFRSPAYMQGISVAGDHLHFISEDKKRGGHVLAFATDTEVEVAAAPISSIHLDLPKDDIEFNEASLKGDSEGISAVEG